VRRYRWTIAGSRYDPVAGCKREYETHFTVALRGSLRENRKKLGLRAAKYHQVWLFKTFGIFEPLSKLIGRYEREARASKVDGEISVKARAMEFRGKNWEATPYPDTRIPLRPSKKERMVLKILRDLEKMAKDRETRLKQNRALKERLWKELVENAKKKLKPP
jgi:hypothetical protein